MAASRASSCVSMLRNLPFIPLKSNLLVANRKILGRCTSRSFCETVPKTKKAIVSVTYVTRDGEDITVDAKEGENLLDVAVNNNIDLEGFGACGGTLACSTCHLIFKQEDYDKIPNRPSDEELDMLDLAFGLSETSRLGCQICVTEDMNGLKVTVPEGTNDARNQ